MFSRCFQGNFHAFSRSLFFCIGSKESSFFGIIKEESGKDFGYAGMSVFFGLCWDRCSRGFWFVMMFTAIGP